MRCRLRTCVSHAQARGGWCECRAWCVLAWCVWCLRGVCLRVRARGMPSQPRPPSRRAAWLRPRPRRQSPVWGAVCAVPVSVWRRTPQPCFPSRRGRSASRPYRSAIVRLRSGAVASRSAPLRGGRSAAGAFSATVGTGARALPRGGHSARMLAHPSGSASPNLPSEMLRISAAHLGHGRRNHPRSSRLTPQGGERAPRLRQAA